MRRRFRRRTFGKRFKKRYRPMSRGKYGNKRKRGYTLSRGGIRL